MGWFDAVAAAARSTDPTMPMGAGGVSGGRAVGGPSNYFQTVASMPGAQMISSTSNVPAPSGQPYGEKSTLKDYMGMGTSPAPQMANGIGYLASQMAPQRVMMRAPDGTTQSVDPAHVDHYTGLGAQVINGSSYGGGGY